MKLLQQLFCLALVSSSSALPNCIYLWQQKKGDCNYNNGFYQKVVTSQKTDCTSHSWVGPKVGINSKSIYWDGKIIKKSGANIEKYEYKTPAADCIGKGLEPTLEELSSLPTVDFARPTLQLKGKNFDVSDKHELSVKWSVDGQPNYVFTASTAVPNNKAIDADFSNLPTPPSPACSYILKAEVKINDAASKKEDVAKVTVTEGPLLTENSKLKVKSNVGEILVKGKGFFQASGNVNNYVTVKSPANLANAFSVVEATSSSFKLVPRAPMRLQQSNYLIISFENRALSRCIASDKRTTLDTIVACLVRVPLLENDSTAIKEGEENPEIVINGAGFHNEAPKNTIKCKIGSSDEFEGTVVSVHSAQTKLKVRFTKFDPKFSGDLVCTVSSKATDCDNNELNDLVESKPETVATVPAIVVTTPIPKPTTAITTTNTATTAAATTAAAVTTTTTTTVAQTQVTEAPTPAPTTPATHCTSGGYKYNRKDKWVRSKGKLAGCQICNCTDVSINGMMMLGMSCHQDYPCADVGVAIGTNLWTVAALLLVVLL